MMKLYTVKAYLTVVHKDAFRRRKPFNRVYNIVLPATDEKDAQVRAVALTLDETKYQLFGVPNGSSEVVEVKLENILGITEHEAIVHQVK